VTDAYVCRLLPLTCLAPDIVEAILDGRQPKGLRLAEMLGNGPLVWEEQRSGGAFLQAQPVACCSQRQSADGDAGSQAVACLRVSVLGLRNLTR
jgi:hypothetical protein